MKTLKVTSLLTNYRLQSKKNESNSRLTCFSTMLIYPSFEKFKLLEIILTSLQSNSYTNLVQYEIHANHLHIYHSEDIKKEKTTILNSKTEEKRGGAVTNICLFIFLFVQEKLKKSLPTFVSATILLPQVWLTCFQKIRKYNSQLYHYKALQLWLINASYQLQG